MAFDRQHKVVRPLLDEEDLARVSAATRYATWVGSLLAALVCRYCRRVLERVEVDPRDLGVTCHRIPPSIRLVVAHGERRYRCHPRCGARHVIPEADLARAVRQLFGTFLPCGTPRWALFPATQRRREPGRISAAEVLVADSIWLEPDAEVIPDGNPRLARPRHAALQARHAALQVPTPIRREHETGHC